MIGLSQVALASLALAWRGPQDAELAALAHVTSRAFASHDFRAMFDERLMFRLDLPGQGTSSVQGALAATTLAEFVRRTAEIEVFLLGSAVVDVGQGYIELRRRFHLIGVQHEQTQRILISARLERGRWRVAEVSVMEASGQRS